MNLFLLICFTLTTLVQLSSESPNAACGDYEALDTCSVNLFIHGNPQHAKVSTTRDEIQQQCRDTKESINCLQSLVDRCYKSGMVKQYFRMVIKGPTNVAKKTCTKKGVKEMLKHRSCLEKSKAVLDACSKVAIEDTIRIRSFANDSTWLSSSCCFASKAQACIKDAVESIDSCTAEAKEYLIKATNELMGESMDLACGSGHDHKGPKCLSLLSSMPALPSDVKKPKTIIPITLQVMSKFLS